MKKTNGFKRFSNWYGFIHSEKAADIYFTSCKISLKKNKNSIRRLNYVSICFVDESCLYVFSFLFHFQPLNFLFNPHLAFVPVYTFNLWLVFVSLFLYYVYTNKHVCVYLRRHSDVFIYTHSYTFICTNICYANIFGQRRRKKEWKYRRKNKWLCANAKI